MMLEARHFCGPAEEYVAFGAGSLRRLRSVDVVVSIADSVLRQGMQKLLSELPLRSLYSARTLRDIDFESIEPSRSVLILAGSDSESGKWSDIPIPCKLMLLFGGLSQSDLMADLSRADGVLLQGDLDIDVLADAILFVLSGGFPMPSEVARILLSQGASHGPSVSRATRMTERQHETLRLLSEGLSNRQIGRRLRISEHGAKRLVSSVLVKLNAPNRASAVTIGIREGLL
ncbi:hypothetical protein CQJ94_16680 [Glycomyces fuscus]|nr:hypothetical protein CQJ94_16680 [Glycomyces fuscus]